MMFAARQKLKVKVDMVILNDDGVRIDQIAAGNVTKGDIFNIMPFENLIVLQQIQGNVLQQFLDLVAADGGWPIAGFSMQIKEGKAVNVIINGQALDTTKTYSVVNSDYIANGGKNAFMLKNIPQQTTGYLIRSALFDYIKYNDNKLSAHLENRVSYAQ
jgi:2',3'-cyclic-nucleotide 2'-phosphodiesterase (5'-nucleotidase family)